ncbi:MAG: type II secretion system F family protein [Candidatus Omnitrophota bacterium]
MSFLPLIILILIFTSIFILANQYFFYKEKERFIKERFQEQSSGYIKETKKTFALKPLLRTLGPVNRRIKLGRMRTDIEQQLLTAGNPLTVDEYLAFKELLILFLPLFLGAAIGWHRAAAYPVLMIIAAAAGFFISSIWLRARVNKRKKEILRALPNVIDLLILAVDAGLDFMIAVRRVLKRTRSGSMTDELSQMCQEVQMGLVRRAALKNMARRLHITEVDSFARTLIQAERMGTPMGKALRALSDEIRTRQFQRGEQQALKAPIKMLFPLLFCILPVVLILVGGPVVLQFFQSGIQFFQ